MSRYWKKWAVPCGCALVSGAFAYPAVRKYFFGKVVDNSAILAPEDLPTLDVTYKHLPQYGKNFKVGQVFDLCIAQTADRV